MEKLSQITFKEKNQRLGSRNREYKQIFLGVCSKIKHRKEMELRKFVFKIGYITVYVY